VTKSTQLTQGQKIFVVMAVFVCGLLFYANAVAFNLISAPTYVGDIIAYSALMVAVSLTIITLTIVIRDKRRSLFIKKQKSIVVNSDKESIERPSIILSSVDSLENMDEVESNLASVQIATEPDKAPVTPLPRSSRKKKLFVILIAVVASLLFFVNAVSFRLIALPEYTMYVALAGVVALTTATIATALIGKRKDAPPKTPIAEVVGVIEEPNKAPEKPDTVSSPTIAQTSTDKVESDIATIETAKEPDKKSVSITRSAKFFGKRNLFLIIVAITAGLLFFANAGAFGLISLPQNSIYAALAGAIIIAAIPLTLLLSDKIKALGHRIKSFLAEPDIQEISKEVKEPDQAPDISTVETSKVPDKKSVPIARSAKFFGKRNLFVIIVAITVVLLFFANAGAFGLISLPKNSIYAALAGAIVIASIPLTILLGDKIKALGHRIKSFLSEPDIQEIINQTKEPDQAPDIAPAPVIAQTGTIKVDPYTEMLRQFRAQKTSRKFESDNEEPEKQLPKKPVIPPTKVICPACRKEFNLPIYEKDFIVDFGPPKKSNIAEPCFYCGALISLKRKDDQEDIWKE
jgi:hypothetical protein